MAINNEKIEKLDEKLGEAREGKGSMRFNIDNNSLPISHEKMNY